MRTRTALLVILMLGLGIEGPAMAQGPARRAQTVPNSDADHPSGCIQGDTWRFNGNRGDMVRIRVDTRDGKRGDDQSELDPIVFLKKPDGTVFAFADDNRACTRPPVCGFSCPFIGPDPVTLDVSGTWTISVRDFNNAIASPTDIQCTGDAYELIVASPSEPLRSSLVLTEDDGCVADPPAAVEAAEAAKGSGQ
jgi:hypothetical protein